MAPAPAPSSPPASARGLSARELLEFYRGFGEEVFRKRSILERWRALYDNGPLERKLRQFFRDPEDLHPQHLRCLLVVVTRNASTDSAWPISSNPWAKYNDCARPDCNLNVPQWKIVRASTAAPVYFSPEVIQWDPDDPAKSFAFVDGGTTAYNCPAFLLARMVTEPAYGLGWPRGECEARRRLDRHRRGARRSGRRPTIPARTSCRPR